jgi:hypothetical protein
MIPPSGEAIPSNGEAIPSSQASIPTRGVAIPRTGDAISSSRTAIPRARIAILRSRGTKFYAAKEYKVTPATKITVNGQPGTLSSLATGMDVTISTASDPTVAATIDARSPQKK